MADSPREANLGLIGEDFDLANVEKALDEARRRLAVSQERISDLERELKAVADEQAEMAQRLEEVWECRAALDRQLREAREEATSLIQHAGRRAAAGSSSNLDRVARTEITGEETAALVAERDRLANQVAELATALTAAQTSQAELSRTVESVRRDRDEIVIRSKQARADLDDAARIMTDDQEGAVHRVETAAHEGELDDRDDYEGRDEAPPDEDVDGLTRYERASAKLPSIGDEASEVIGSLEDLRESLRHR